MTTRYTISWTKAARHTGRWLYLDEQGNALLIHHPLRATKFTREEANTILLALWTAGRWAEAGEGSYPHLEEIRNG